MSEAISGTGFRTYCTRISLRSCGLLARLIATASVASVARMSEAISGTGFRTYRAQMSLRSCGLRQTTAAGRLTEICFLLADIAGPILGQLAFPDIAMKR